MRGLSPWFDLSCAPSHLVGGGQRLHLGVSSVAGMRRGLAASNATVPACPRARARRVPAPAFVARHGGDWYGERCNAERSREAALHAWAGSGLPVVAPDRTSAARSGATPQRATMRRELQARSRAWTRVGGPAHFFFPRIGRPAARGRRRQSSERPAAPGGEARMAQQIEEQLRDLIEPLAKAAGLDVVAVAVKGSGGARKVRIAVDRKGG